jgi:hypothetical protein
MFDEINKLYITQNKTTKEVAALLGISLGSLKYLIGKYKITKTKNLASLPEEPTSEQQQIITGSLLGDGSLKGGSRFNWKFIKPQKSSRLEYLQWHFEKLGCFSCSIVSNNSFLKFKYYNGIEKISYSKRYSTHSHPYFTNLALNWYKNTNGSFVKNDKNTIIKIIPPDLKLTPLSLAVWYCDDGTNDVLRKCIKIYTNCFSQDECQFLIYRLENDLNIKSCSINWSNSQPTIYVPRRSYYDFIDIVSPNVTWDCFKYKTITQ